MMADVRRMLVSCVAVALLAAACGDGGSSTADGSGSVTSATGETTSTTGAPPTTSTLAASTTSPTTQATSTTQPEEDSTTTTDPATTVPGVDDPEGLVSLVAGHNDLSARRINLVMAHHGFPADVDSVEYARRLVTWDGPVALGPGREPVDSGGPDPVYELTYGPFAVEPLRSHRDLFNVWYLEEPAPSPTAYGAEDRQLPVELPNRLVVTLAWEWEGGAVGVPPEFVPPELPEAGSDVFSGLVIGVYSDDPSFLDETLAHELGHSLFSLADKYVFDKFGYDGRRNWSFYPACASDQTAAEATWGELLGTVDPFFETFIQEHADAGIPIDPAAVESLEDLIRIDYVANGCFGPEGVAIRSSKGGLMYDERVLPVMDAVNRRWAEQVLDAWAG